MRLRGSRGTRSQTGTRRGTGTGMTGLRDTGTREQSDIATPERTGTEMSGETGETGETGTGRTGAGERGAGAGAGRGTEAARGAPSPGAGTRTRRLISRTGLSPQTSQAWTRPC